MTEEDYRLSPQEIQRRVQKTLAAQVRSLLEARLQERLQQVQQAEAERLTSQRQAVCQDRANTWSPNESEVVTGAAAEVTVEIPAEGNVTAEAAAQVITDAPPFFTTSRLTTPGATSAAAAPPPPAIDLTKYADTINSHPYSAVELVRVHRLKGISDYNRGLFAGLARRSFTTRSGHLVVNPGREGKGRVRSAVSGCVWEEEQHRGGHTHLDAAAANNDNSSNNVSPPTASDASYSTSSARRRPPHLAMKIVDDGNHVSFTWTEDDSGYGAVGGGGGGENAASPHLGHTALTAAVKEVLDHTYGKPLTAKEKAEAERRLRQRRRKELQPPQSDIHGSSDTGDDDKAAVKGDARVTGGQTNESTPRHNVRPTISASSQASSSGVGGDSFRTPPNEGPLLTHDLLPIIPDTDVADTLTVSDHHLPVTVAADNAAAAVGTSTSSSSRLPHGPTSASGVEVEVPPNVAGCGPGPTPASRASFPVSEQQQQQRQHTTSVNEAQERQCDPQRPAEQLTAAQSPPPLARDGGSNDSVGQDKSQSGGFGESHAAPTSPRPPRQTTATPGGRTGDEVSTQPVMSDGVAAAVARTPPSALQSNTSGPAANGLPTPPRAASTTTTTTITGLTADAITAGTSVVGAGTKANAVAPKDDAEHRQLDAFLEHFPEAEAHVQLRREAKNVLDELEDMWDEDKPVSERPFPLPQFASQEFVFPGCEDSEAEENGNRQRPHGDGDDDRKGDCPSRGDGAGRLSDDPQEEAVVGFDMDVEALRAKFTAEALEECADLAARHDALLADVAAKRQLISDFGNDVHFLSVGSEHDGLSAEQYAIELTRDVNAYARQNHLHFNRLTAEEEEDVLRDQAEEEGFAASFLRRFGGDRVPTRDVGCQVSDADLCYVDAAVRSTEAQLESLIHHEKALLNAVQLATVAVANILSFHASLEMESTCHECFFIFDKPRTLWPCGHTFCYTCLSTMYNSRGDLICSECGSVCEVGYTPNLPMELIANYQTVYTRPNADTKGVASSALAEERDAQTIEGVLRNLLNDLLSTEHSWTPASPKKER